MQNPFTVTFSKAPEYTYILTISRFVGLRTAVLRLSS